MKFYITKSSPVLSAVGRQVGYDWLFSFTNVETDAQCFLASDSIKFNKLKRLLRTPLDSWKTAVTVAMGTALTEDKRFRKCSLRWEDRFLDELCKQSTDKITVKILLELAETSYTLETKDMEIVAGTNCENIDINFPDKLFSKSIPQYQQLNGFLTIIITTPDRLLKEDLEESAEENGIVDVGNLTRSILEQETLSDLTIVAGDDAQIKTHKVFLAFHSPVLRALLQNDMKEVAENTIEIPDMSERGVRAFLKFLYYRDTEDAVNDSAIAFQLFHAGHKYDVKMLEDDMIALLLNQPCEWFKDVEVAVKMFMLARNLVPVHEPLKVKAIQVLKKNSKNLENFSAFRKLFNGNVAVLDLCMSALTD